ncbi:efflux RND transporter permease subunit [Uliginosibacterium sp. 31-16]|uniref:efflux RND transporter permease subunit n=1 Tax=Uliginosibacterium sp. 31-16 TaxID=3068315 RepID=UPI00273E0330|nr:efflux RND transporter permease subunit [Uliginosibacterium sp. 31-16]MDP5238392.1 efflux RND transporter permease subunit [Uliginosibacterium sp. 31-16]
MKKFNLSDWGLRHPQLVLFMMLVLTLIGMGAYTRLGQSEDPPFTFKVMVVTANWPGATAREVELQVTDKLEKKLREMNEIETLRSFSRPGYSQIIVVARDSLHSSQMKDIWYQVRKKIGDSRQSLPSGVNGPYFNDEFGDTFGNIFALTGDGLSYTELKRYAEAIRQEFLNVPDVAKVEFFGEQEQRVYAEFSPMQMAALGIDPKVLMAAIAEQNSKVSSGYFELADERIYLRPAGEFGDLEAIRALPIRAGGRTIRLGDVAEIKRGYIDPPATKMRFQGHEALGIGISMREGGDIIALGKHLDRVTRRIDAQLPLGVKMERVANQPQAVTASVQDFVHSLTEAVVIVLAVSLLSLGFRTGVVVAISIPVVLAITFLFMYLFNVGLHKISLGALILALGLLVDDAIIAVEMMATKMEQGWERARAAAFAYTSTSMPMLSGTLVTAAGFLPIATAASSTGEYTRSIFEVTVIALLVSWVAAVLFVPFIGYYLLPDFSKRSGKTSLLVRVLAKIAPRLAVRLIERSTHVHAEAAIYSTPFYDHFRRAVAWCVRHRWLVIGATLASFAVSIWGFRFVPQQFFPDSVRPELLVDLRLQQGASVSAVERSVKRVEQYLARQDGIENYVAYVGGGSPRFYLPLDQQLPQANFAQFVILTKGSPEREALRNRLIQLFQTDFPELRASINRLENGPPVGFPVQYRVSGPDEGQIQQIADRIAVLMRGNVHLANVQKDWDEASKVVRIRIDTEKARIAGLSRQEVQNFLATALNGGSVTQFREGTETIEVYLRGRRSDMSIDRLSEMNIAIGNGRGVALSQIATLVYDFEPGLIWRRNRVPTVTVRASLYGSVQPSEVVKALAPQIAQIEQSLPLGYHLAVGGSVEESAKGGTSVAAGVPLFILVVLTILMLQLQSFSRVIMVVLTAPLGMIGVTLALLVFAQPFGFVAMLGTIALSGMIMRNSVILIDQIDQDEKAGVEPVKAIIEATVRRFRPIMLTAAAAILAMIPLSRSAFFGPMAVAIMGGLLIATVLTLLFLPALYAAWYRTPVVGRSG